jgi:transposase-like protein
MTPCRRPDLPPRAKAAEFDGQAETDVLAYMSFPPARRAKFHSTNLRERVNGVIKRRAEVVGIFPDDAAIIRLVGAILLEQNDEWSIQRAHFVTLATLAPISDDPVISLRAMAN